MHPGNRCNSYFSARFIALTAVAGLMATGLPQICAAAADRRIVECGSIFDDDFKPSPNAPAQPVPKVPDEPAPTSVPRLPPSPSPTNAPEPPPVPTVPDPAQTTRPPSSTVPVPTGHVPTASESANAEKLIKQVFAAEYKSHTPTAKAALAHALLNETRESQDLPTLYVLFKQARDLATSGGDPEAALEAVRGLRDWFQTADKPADTEHAAVMSAAGILCSVAPTNPPRPDVRSQAMLLMGLAERDFNSGAYSSSAQMAAEAELVARKTIDTSLTERIHDRAALLQNISAEFERTKSAMAALKVSPADPAANETAGRFYAFVADRPDIGMPYLAKGIDPAIKAAATLELTAPTDSAGQVAVANSWAALIKGPSRDAIRRRAIYWYDLAGSTGNGLEQITLQKKSDNLRVQNLKNGLRGEYFRGEEFTTRVFSRIDTKLEFNWGGRRPDPDIPAEYFSIRWTGYIKSPAAGSYRRVVVHDDGVKIWVDGQLILDKWGNWGRDTVDVTFTGALQSLKIEYQQLGGNSNFGLGLMSANAKKVYAIPPEQLFHEDRPAAPVLELIQTQPTANPADGISLSEACAMLHNPANGLQLGRAEGGRPEHTEGWGALADWLSWEFTAPAGDYDVTLNYACDGGNQGAEYVVLVGNARLKGQVGDSGGWSSYQQEPLGRVHLTAGGQTLRLIATKKPHGIIMDVNQITLTPVRANAQ